MEAFPQLIAQALHAEWGASSSARKTVGRITNANERAVRNWFEGRNAPSGENLVSLIRHSDAVLETVLVAADRKNLLPQIHLTRLKVRLQDLLDLLDQPPPQS
jgi:hypothetical protein